ncbi:HupE/UreJ family protein (plasmid) [Marinovum sp. KMM 9989]
MNTFHRGWTDFGARRIVFLLFVTSALLILSTGHALAHNVTPGDAGYIQEIWGVNLIPFMYLGAKHMVTGYDHILFLFGVVFFLYKMKDVALYVSIFAVGHSTTMLAGVWLGWGINAYIVDAIIGLSVVYKALDNLGAYQRWFGVQPNTKAATLIFGFFHGTGLATKLLDYEIASDGLLANLLAFNVGVEIGQLMALAVILIVMGFWRKSPKFFAQAYTVNVVMMSMGFILMGMQITGYFVAT